IAALKWASYPGYSEHQLGLAVDINSADQENCSNDRVWDWMKRNCQNYGFIWRYPGVKSDITGISNEDWHFRYVGKEAAVYIMSNRLCLEEYLQQQYGIE
ncbi:MAG: M15 family metallopeptidase, partial [Clostridia bacterium]|nr:M15 family metallopeptidase [Clostridia bacterium]